MSDPMGDVQEIQRLLAEAYDHYFALSDGYCKPSEGAVSLHWPNYFEMRRDKRMPSCSVYSYVLGPSRNHDFATTEHALAAVREWHREEMATTYHEEGATQCEAVFREPFSDEESAGIRCDLDAGHDDGHQSGDDRTWWLG